MRDLAGLLAAGGSLAGPGFGLLILSTLPAIRLPAAAATVASAEGIMGAEAGVPGVVVEADGTL